MNLLVITVGSLGFMRGADTNGENASCVAPFERHKHVFGVGTVKEQLVKLK